MLRIFLLLAGIALMAHSCKNEDQRSPAVLVFTKTAGFRHASIPAGVAALRAIAEREGWVMDTTEDAGRFTPAGLAPFDAVVFLNTTGDILNADQQAAFEDFIRRGGGFAGIHAATDTEYDWPWYGQLVGAYFNGHPAVQEGAINVVMPQHPATAHLPDPWVRVDEWYNFRDLQPTILPLLNLDESSYTGGNMGAEHPIAWYHEFDGGKVFYTAGGHTTESYDEPLFVEHLAGGLRYILE